MRGFAITSLRNIGMAYVNSPCFYCASQLVIHRQNLIPDTEWLTNLSPHLCIVADPWIHGSPPPRIKTADKRSASWPNSTSKPAMGFAV
jgi:hypothetical protein